MEPNVALTQRLYARSRELFPTTPPPTPAMLTVVAAAEVCQDWFNMQRFEPAGDRHHNAMECPHCRQSNVVIAIPYLLAQKFINTSGEWTIDNEKDIIRAFRSALENCA